MISKIVRGRIFFKEPLFLRTKQVETTIGKINQNNLSFLAGEG